MPQAPVYLIHPEMHTEAFNGGKAVLAGDAIFAGLYDMEEKQKRGRGRGSCGGGAASRHAGNVAMALGVKEQTVSLVACIALPTLLSYGPSDNNVGCCIVALLSNNI